MYNDGELRDRQRRSLDQVTSVLSVSEGDAVRLLCEYKWCALLPCMLQGTQPFGPASHHEVTVLLLLRAQSQLHGAGKCVL